MIVAVIQARMGSSRLPGKVLLPLGNTNLLSLMIERLLKSRKIERIIVATTTNPGDDRVVEAVDDLKRHREPHSLIPIECYRGSERDVLDRFYQSIISRGDVEYIVRLTADCPLIDPNLVDELITEAMAKGYDYFSNTLTPSFPDGMDVEVIKAPALVTAWENAVLPSDREHVTPYIWRNSSVLGGDQFHSGRFFSGDDSYNEVRLTVDEESDYKTISALVAALGEDAGWKTYADYYRQHTALQYNRSIIRNEGYRRSLTQDKAIDSDK